MKLEASIKRSLIKHTLAILSVLLSVNVSHAGIVEVPVQTVAWYESPWVWVTAAIAFVFVLSRLLGSNKRPL